MKKRGILVEAQVGLIILILAFSEFAPVSINLSTIGFYTAFALSGFATLYNIYGEVKKGSYFSSSILVLLGGALLYYDGYWSIGIIILCANLMLCSQRNFIEEIINKKLVKYMDQLNGQCTAFSKGKEVEVDSSKLQMGNVFLVGTSQMIPTDGMVFHGKGMVDEAIFYNDSHVREVKEGSLVFGGAINIGEPLQIEAISSQEESLLGQQIRRLEGFLSKKSQGENNLERAFMASKGVLLGLGILFILLPILSQSALEEGSHKIAAAFFLFGTVENIFYVVLNFFRTYVLRLNKKGISPRDFDSLNKTKDLGILAIEKIGNLSEGSYQLTTIVNEEGYLKEELLIYAAHCEAKSNHPISKAVMDGYLQLIRYKNLDVKDAIKYDFIQKFEELASMGVTAKVKGKFIFVGNEKLMKLINIRGLKSQGNLVWVHIAVDGKYAGKMGFEYEAKEGIEEINLSLSLSGVRKYAPIDKRDKSLVEELMEEKSKTEKLGVILNEASDIILGENKEAAAIAIGCKNARKIGKSRDIGFLNDDLQEAISFIGQYKAFYKKTKVAILLSGALKAVIYLGGFFLDVHLSTVFTVDSLITIGLYYWSSK